MMMGIIKTLDPKTNRIYVSPEMKTTSFKSGGSLAVRIPKEFRFDAKHVEIERRGASLILTPTREENGWPEGFFEKLKANAAETDFIRHPQGEHREIIW